MFSNWLMLDQMPSVHAADNSVRGVAPRRTLSQGCATYTAGTDPGTRCLTGFTGILSKAFLLSATGADL